MNFNEPVAAFRRIPIYLEDTLGLPAPGEVIVGAEIQVSLSGAAFVNGAGVVVEGPGAGAYYYEATQPETVTDSFLMIKVDAGVGFKPFVYAVDIGIRININEPSPTRRRLPIYLEDGAGLPVPGLAIGGADSQISENGTAFVNGVGAVTEIGSGAYYYELALAEVNVGGFGLLKIDKAPALPYVYTYDILAPNPANLPVVSNLEPPNGTPILPTTPIQFDITDPDGFLLIIPMISMNPFTLPEPTHNTENFEPLYENGGSTRVSIPSGFRYTLRRVGGWYATPKLIIWAVDITGAIWIGP